MIKSNDIHFETKKVEVPASKTLLVVVDMQNDFVRPSGNIYVGPMAPKSVAKIKRLLHLAREKNVRIIYTQSWYDKNNPRFVGKERARGTVGCVANTGGAEIIRELRPKGELRFKKSSYDCWFGTNLEKALLSLKGGIFSPSSVHHNRERNEFYSVITGTATNVCVESAVHGFYLRGYELIIPIDCVSASSALEQACAINHFEKYYGARITSSDLITFVQ